MFKSFATMVWKSDIGGTKQHTKRTVVDAYIAGLAGLEAFANSLSAFSKCTLYTRQWARTQIHDSSSPDAGSNNDRIATIYMLHPTDGEVSFSYPDPVDSDVEQTPAGERIKQSSLATLVGHVNLYTGQTFTPLYGTVTQRR